LKSARVFVFPSREEGWAISVWEAMACGAPVIAYDLEAYNGLKGGIAKVPVGDIGGMANAILTLLQNESDRGLMRDAAMREVRGFDWATIIEEEAKSLLP
jgi:glycosyltransferase involved in cell wall biosynthesis